MNDYTYWEKALANPKALRAREYRISAVPEAGFYRVKHGNRAPVAIFWDDDELVMQVDGREVHEHDQENVWLSCAMYPVTEEAYNQRMATGKWPDMDAAVMASLGDNIAGAEDHLAITQILADLIADLSDYDTIEDDQAAARAAGLRNRINELRLRADKLRKDEKEPHLRAGKAVDEAWQPLIKRADHAGTQLRNAISVWETKKLKALREAEAAQAAKIWPEGLEAVPEPDTQIRPAYGRAQAVKVVKVVVGMTDPVAVLRYLLETDRAMIVAYLQELAQKAVNNGHTVPGVVIEEQARV